MKGLEPGPEENLDQDEDGVELGARIAAEETAKSVERTQSNLIKYATDKGFSAAGLGSILKKAGVSGFDPSRWEGMIQAVDKAVLAGEIVMNEKSKRASGFPEALFDFFVLYSGYPFVDVTQPERKIP